MRKRVAIAALIAVLLTVGCATKNWRGEAVKTCQVHSARLHGVRVPTARGLVKDNDVYSAAREQLFRNAGEPTRHGCVVGPLSWMNRHDNVLACNECARARDSWLKEHEREARGETSKSRVVASGPLAGSAGYGSH